MSRDGQLQKSVLAELAWEPSITAAHIGVTADDGVVTLSGHVDSFVQKHAAEDAARRVRGVRAVAEEIEVRLAFDMTRGDDDIAKATADRLAWDSSVPRDSVQARVEAGWVTLTGEVQWYFQKQAAVLDVRDLTGVTGLTDQITIRPGEAAGDISDEITHALHRSWFFDPTLVNVSASNSAVRLSGTVKSSYERQVAGETAWAARGTVSVENDILVG